MSTIARKYKAESGTHRKVDHRDRLILALYAELKAERQTRAALEETIRNGGLSKEVLVAMASDPVPVITGDDIAEVERYLAADHARGQAPGSADDDISEDRLPKEGE